MGKEGSMGAARARNAAFSVLVCLFLLGPASLFLAEKAGADLPGWLTAEDAKYLTGGVVQVDLKAQATFSGFRDGKLQSVLQAEIGNFVPMKASALLGGAALQRAFIASSNALFGWECYPTFYGSGTLFVPGLDALTAMPREDRGYAEWGLASFGEAAGGFAAAHPETEVVVYLVGGYDCPAVDPADGLVSGAVTFGDAMTFLEASLGDAPNVHLLGNSPAGLDGYYRDFFRSDHHWNIDGALGAYAAIANALGMPEAHPGEKIVAERSVFLGSRARSSLDLVGDAVYDRPFDCSGLRLVGPAGEDAGAVGYGWDVAETPDGRTFTFYNAYYDNLGDCEIVGGAGDGRVLLVSNSYGAALMRPLALSSASLKRANDVHPSRKGRTALSDGGEFDAVVFVANPGDYASFMSRNPGYFG